MSVCLQDVLDIATCETACYEFFKGKTVDSLSNEPVENQCTPEEYELVFMNPVMFMEGINEEELNMVCFLSVGFLL